MKSPMPARIVAILLVGAQLNLAAGPVAAGTFTTNDYLGYESPAAGTTVGQRAERIARVRDFLAEQHVLAQLQTLGVDPTIADARIALLSDTELARLDARLTNMPAGSSGVVVIVGAVFIVLLILELVGVTNVFTGL